MSGQKALKCRGRHGIDAEPVEGLGKTVVAPKRIPDPYDC
jgi:hypothetical protein